MSTDHKLFEDRGQPKRYRTEVLLFTSLTDMSNALPLRQTCSPAPAVLLADDEDIKLNVLGYRVDILGTNCDQCVSMVQCCFTSTRKPQGSLGRGTQDGHLDFHTAPELFSVLFYLLALCPQMLKSISGRTMLRTLRWWWWWSDA